LFFLLIASTSLFAQDKGTPVVIKEGMTMRDVSRQYLGNPDLWEDILRANQLNGIAEVKPGMTIFIPVQAITNANKAIDQAGSVIQEATKTGARIFAAEPISKAIQLRDTAIEKRKAGDWAECTRLGNAAAVEAKKALDISIANKNVPADAALAFKKGTVEKRKSVENSWKDLPLHGMLVEEERVRTLTESYAEILFRDDSRIRLNANSQAHIKKMRANLVENSDEASVSLIEGDVMALLAGGKKSGSFKLEVPNVETKINSERFWVGRNEESAKFANFNGELEIAAGGGKVTIKENEGSIVQKGQKPTPPKELLPPPALLSPSADIELFDLKNELKWGVVVGASSYRLEIATENEFTKMVSSRDTKETKLSLPTSLEEGLYYWRATGVSGNGMPGNPSEGRIFRFIMDSTPPFLTITSPQNEISTTASTIKVMGSVETQSLLLAGSDTIRSEKDGTFNFDWKLNTGKNTIILKAIDRAGNVSQLSRTVDYNSNDKIELKLNLNLPRDLNGAYLTSSRGLLLTGETAPQAKINVALTSGKADFKSVSNQSGHFEVNLQLTDNTEEFKITATSTTGLMVSEKFVVSLDDTPPSITFDEYPSSIAQESISITGSVTDASRLECNSTPVSLTSGRFSLNLPLKAGLNNLRWIAYDQVGNQTVVEQSIVSDTDAPELVKSSITPPQANGGESITVQVWAKDATRLRKAASFSLQIGGFNFTDNLILTDPDKGIYSATVKAPLDSKGAVKLTMLKLSDQLGNSCEFPPWDQR